MYALRKECFWGGIGRQAALLMLPKKITLFTGMRILFYTIKNINYETLYYFLLV